MSDEENREESTVIAFVLGIVLLVVLGVIGGVLALVNSQGTPTAPAAAKAAVDPVAANQPAAAPATHMASKAKLYFASGIMGVPADAAQVIAPIVAFARANPGVKLAISGFHDKTGSAEQNAEIAKNRAKAVKDLLLSAGVPEAQLVMQKPQEMVGGADDREARRVEIAPL